MDLLGFIKQDHEEMRNLLQRLTGEADPARESIRGLQETLADLLVNHSKMEEQFLYPRMCEVQDAKDLINDSYKEHEEAIGVLKIIAKLHPLTEEWSRQCEKLRKAVERHMGEEEDRLFAMIRRNLDDQEMNRICQQMLQLREERMVITPDIPVEPTG
ncbi:MAG TPA: hemerythrin domain-containing protein [Coleofasciculaceae cyanobacterium]|jgi:iron-sulfur cluster repair protein YtfE (RIC family)